MPGPLRLATEHNPIYPVKWLSQKKVFPNDAAGSGSGVVVFTVLVGAKEC